MATEAEISRRVRLELGDIPEHFRFSARGNGEQNDFDLPARNILINSVTAFRVNEDNSITNYALGVHFTLDPHNGVITFSPAPEEDARIIVEGDSYGIFSDEDLHHFIADATAQHLKGRVVENRYRNGRGFITYDRRAMELEDLPAEESLLVSLLATIEALWALSTDASLDIDVQTAEGTSLPRGQRWRQITAQIDILTEKYKETSMMLGVGLHAPEVLTMRRVSRTTGRLVPIFKTREYDEVGPPIRKIPPRGDRDEDPDGPLSPAYGGTWGH